MNCLDRAEVARVSIRIDPMFDSPADPYTAALHFLYGRINYERNMTLPYRQRGLNLEQMRRLLELLGNPQDQLPIVHIAGTKGKGSTAAMISAVLGAAGYRVGLYTSPHLSRLEERFAVNGVDCTSDQLVQLVDALKEIVEQIDREARLPHPVTFFEITTAMALLHFVKQQVDVAVLEVGMGGRLDSTNVCRPRVSVITSISFDHTKQLGNTLAAIAREKAGIIKPNIPVISGVVKAEPAAVIEEIAAHHASPLFRRNHEFFCEYLPASVSGPGVFNYREANEVSGWKLDRVQTSMLGRHQAANGSLALATLNRLREQGWVISDEACRHGLATARCPARIEVVARRPTVILDTAHNLASVEALIDTLEESFPSAPRTLIFAVARDKDAAGMLAKLLPHFQHVYLTQFRSNPRTLPLSTLTELAQGVLGELELQNVEVRAFVNAEAAWDACRSNVREDEVVCITGSFFLAAELRPLVN